MAKRARTRSTTSTRGDPVEILLLTAAALAGIAAGLWLGLRTGGRLQGGQAWRYWMCNALALIGGMLFAFLGQLVGAQWLAVAGLGFSGGGITGLKYGYGASVGVWAIHDRLLRSGDLPQEPAKRR